MFFLSLSSKHYYDNSNFSEAKHLLYEDTFDFVFRSNARVSGIVTFHKKVKKIELNMFC